MKIAIAFALLVFSVGTVGAHGHDHMVRTPVQYEINGGTFEGVLIHHAAKAKESLPAILMFPNWMGPSEASYEKAELIAGDRYAVFVADMYGTDVRPSSGGEASAAAGFVRADRDLMRARASAAIQVFSGLAGDHPVDAEKMLAIGFCFGGGVVLELARSGTNAVAGVVSFHGDVLSPTLQRDAANVVVPQLVLHGADDPFVPQEDIQAYIKAMQEGGVQDWSLVQFSNTVHSFTDPTAQSEGARYHERSANRAFAMMQAFAAELLKLD